MMPSSSNNENETSATAPTTPPATADAHHVDTFQPTVGGEKAANQDFPSKDHQVNYTTVGNPPNKLPDDIESSGTIVGHDRGLTNLSKANDTKSPHDTPLIEGSAEDGAIQQEGLSGLAPYRGIGPPEDENAVADEYECTDVKIPEDSFSMAFVAETWIECVPTIVVFCIQISVLALIAFNLLQDDGRKVPLNSPVDVPTEVTVAQVIACLISVFTSTDLVDGLIFFGKMIRRDGRAEDSYWRWQVPNLFRLLEGSLIVGVSFVFIVQSQTVIDLFLNFAGVAFVSELDDVMYSLSEKGMFGSAMEEVTARVPKCKCYTNRKSPMRIIRYGIFAAIPLGMVAGLASVAYFQDKPKYACKSVTITVGELKDFYDPMRINGMYALDDTCSTWRKKWPVYIRRHPNDAYLAYCDDINRWTVTTFSPVGQDNTKEYSKKCLEWKPCDDFHLQSEKTRTYDVTEIETLKHRSGDDVDGSIKCNDCIVDDSGETCGNHGVCEDTNNLTISNRLPFETPRCYCDDGWFGDSCQFQGPCTELQFRGDSFPGYESSWLLLEDEKDDLPVMYYDRPVYYQGNTTCSDCKDLSLLVFSGGRWFLLWDLRNWNSTEKTISEYVNGTDLFYGYDTDYISELSYEGLPTSIPFVYSLTEQTTVETIGVVGEKEYTLLCADCFNEVQDENMYRGISYCQDPNGANDDALCIVKEGSSSPQVNRCACPLGFGGPLCETRPIEGELILHLEHDEICSVCGDYSESELWQLGLDATVDAEACTPFPREPLIFDWANSTKGEKQKMQLGLHLNNTHLSVFVSDVGRYFPIDTPRGATELICNTAMGANELYSIERNILPVKGVKLDFAVVFDENNTMGEIVDTTNVDCNAQSLLDESKCDGSSRNSLRKVYYDAFNKKSHLTRAWIQLDLKVSSTWEDDGMDNSVFPTYSPTASQPTSIPTATTTK